MAAKAPSSEGGNTRDRLADMNPSTIRLVRSFGHDRIEVIMFSPDDDTTLSQRISRLSEDMKAFEAASFSSTNLNYASLLREAKAFTLSYNEDEDEDEYEDEDGDEDDKTGKILGDEKKPGVVKRPQYPTEGELECKKPRIAQGSGCQGEGYEPKHSSGV